MRARRMAAVGGPDPAALALVLPLWVAVAVLAALLTFVGATLVGRLPALPPILTLAAGHAALWAVMSPAVMELSRTVAPSQGMRRAIGVHLLALVLFVWVSVAFGNWLALAAGAAPVPAGPSLGRVEAAILAYLVVVGAERALRYRLETRRARSATEDLERRLGQTHLEMLSLQLQPHFLFNTLNTIAELVHREPQAADEMITRLVRLLRITYQRAGHQIVPFRQELELLKAYLGIEQVRFRGRLEVKWECTPEALAAGVPTLVWQPALENAIRHGVGRIGAPGRLRLSARREADDLVLEIEDNGTGIAEPERIREGVGISNIRGRVRHFYGPRASFTLRPGPEGGTVASLRIPYEPCTSPHTPVPLALPPREDLP